MNKPPVGCTKTHWKNSASHTQEWTGDVSGRGPSKLLYQILEIIQATSVYQMLLTWWPVSLAMATAYEEIRHQLLSFRPVYQANLQAYNPHLPAHLYKVITLWGYSHNFQRSRCALQHFPSRLAFNFLSSAYLWKMLKRCCIGVFQLSFIFPTVRTGERKFKSLFQLHWLIFHHQTTFPLLPTADIQLPWHAGSWKCTRSPWHVSH